LPCDEFEGFDGGASDRRFADDEQSVIAPSKVGVPPLSARVEKQREEVMRAGWSMR
jgi:hypothetical protein